MNEYVSSINSNIYIGAAKNLGYDVDIIDKELSYGSIESGSHKIFFKGTCLSVNSATAERLLTDKYATSKLLRRDLDQFVPASLLLRRNQDCRKKIKSFLRKYKDIVIKPNAESLAKGVLVKPKKSRVEKFQNDLRENKNRYSKYLIEEFVRGENEYRIIVWKGDILDVIHRIPANVIGDGISSLKELIDAKNSEKRKQNLPEITVNHDFLDHKGLNTELIPSSGEKIFLNQVCNVGRGGDVKRIQLEDLNQKYHHIAKKTYKLTRANLIGIDVITDDVSLHPLKSNTGINELNSAPMPELQYFSDINTKNPFKSIEILLERIIKSNLAYK